MKPRLVYFLFGAVSLLAQVILIRRLLSVFYGNELTIGALFSGWMFWSGAGSLGFSRLSDRSRNPERGLSIIFFMSALIFVLAAGSTWLVRYILGVSPAVMAGFEFILFAGFLFCAPSCILLGAGFNFAARSFKSDEQNLVRLYIYEAIGSAFAGALSLLMSGTVSAFSQALVCAALSALGGTVLLARKSAKLLAAGLTALFLAGLLGFSSRIENTLVAARWRGQEVVLEKESKYSTITITRSEGQTNFWLDGFPAFSFPNPEFFEQVVHLPLAMCQNPARILLVGGGLVPAAQEIFKHPVKELVYIQIDPELTLLEQKYLPGLDARGREARIRIIHKDARIFLRRNQERFDAIILNLPSPETASLNRYYTREFFELAQKNLNQAGVLGLSIGSSGNYLSDAQAELLANAALTLGQVFEKFAVLPLGQNYIVASESSPWITENPDEIIARLKSRGVQTKYVREYFLSDNLSRERLEAARNRLSGFMNQPANQDLRPRGYYLSNLLWLEQASPERRGIIKKIWELSKKPLYLGLAGYLLLGLALVFWKRHKAFANLSIFSVGFAGIASELILMLAFQAAYGYVYYLLAGLVSAFMVGLALGAYLYQRFEPEITKRGLLSLVLVLILEAVSVALALAGVVWVVKYSLSEPVTLVLIFGLLILVALFSGLCFPICAHLFRTPAPSDLGYTAGWINGFDHFGSCLGAFLASAFLIPLFGLGFGLWYLILLIAAGLIAGLVLIRGS